MVICLCAAVISAPQGYQYNQQQNSFPAGLSNLISNSQVDTAAKTQNSVAFLQQAANSGNLQQPLLAEHNSQQFSSTRDFSKFQQAPQQNINYNGIEQHQQAPLFNNFNRQQQQLHEFQQQQYQAPSSITKDIYVHIAPEESLDQQYRQPALSPPPPRKHYRIVFIKAPSQKTNQASVRIQQAPAEEKTIIYVLTKKEDPLDLQAAIQEMKPKQPSKPEVYFIKYKTKEEAQHAQRTIQAQYDKLGGTSQISDEGIAPVASVVGSLDGSHPQSSLHFSNGIGHSSISSAASSSSSSFSSSESAKNGSKYWPPIVKF